MLFDENCKFCIDLVYDTFIWSCSIESKPIEYSEIQQIPLILENTLTKNDF